MGYDVSSAPFGFGCIPIRIGGGGYEHANECANRCQRPNLPVEVPSWATMIHSPFGWFTTRPRIHSPFGWFETRLRMTTSMAASMAAASMMASIDSVVDGGGVNGGVVDGGVVHGVVDCDDPPMSSLLLMSPGGCNFGFRFGFGACHCAASASASASASEEPGRRR